MQVKVERLTEFSSLMRDWVSLYSRADAASFYLSPSWIGAWLKNAQNYASDLYRVEVKNEQGLQLLGVMGVKKLTSWPLLGVTEGRLLETADARLDSIYVEYNDFLVASDAPENVRRKACEEIFRKIKGPTSFIFRNIRPALRHALLSACTETGWPMRVIHEGATYAIDLKNPNGNDPEKGDDILASLSRNSRTKIERSIRLYEERGELTVSLATSSEARAQAWSNLQKLHQAGWERRGQPGAFKNAALLEFHRDLQDMKADVVDLLTVRVGEDILGCLYNFKHNQSVMNYQSGFKYESDNRLKPGLVTHLLAAEYYQSEGVAYYDMLYGEAQYKKTLGRTHDRLSVIEVERPGVGHKARNMVKKARKSLMGLAGGG